MTAGRRRLCRRIRGWAAMFGRVGPGSWPVLAVLLAIAAFPRLLLRRPLLLVRLRTAGSERVPVWLRPSASDARNLVEVLALYELPLPLPDQSVRTVLDLGAAFGAASAVFAARFPNARILSVEPAPDNVEVLRRNARRSGRAWQTVPVAVGVAAGVAPFHHSRWSTSGSLVPLVGLTRQNDPTRAEHRTARPPLEVPVVPVDQVLADHGLARVDVCKVDIEGAEDELVAGAAGDWLDRVTVLLVEVHDKYVDGAQVRRSIEDRGFRRLATAGRTNLDCYMREPTG